MDLDLTPAQTALRDKTREIASRDLLPKAADTDREQRFPRDSLALLGGLGMLGVRLPCSFGGAGLDSTSCVLMLEELASACASTATLVALQNALVCDPMFRFGSDAQKQEWLATLASGAKLGCFAFSEPGSGSDAAGLTTVAQREGNGYVLRGSKSFVTAASHASLAIVFAALQPGSTNSLTAFLVPMETAGVSLGLAHNKLGLRGATASSLNLKDVRIPANAVLGCEGGGLEVLGFAEEGRSIAAAAVAVGLACAAFAAATQYARTQKSNGVPIATQQTIQFKLADMSTQIDAARLLTWQAASSRDEGAPMGAQASMAKLVASEVASRVASDAVQVLGSNGCLMENAVERHFRDAKVTEIYDGTSEMQRLDIASVLLKD